MSKKFLLFGAILAFALLYKSFSPSKESTFKPQVKRTIAGAVAVETKETELPPDKDSQELTGLNQIKLNLISELMRGLEEESKKEGFLYRRCIPKYKSDCEMLCVNDFGDPVTCEITRQEETYRTACRIGAVDCGETEGFRLVEKIISHRKIVQDDNGACITQQRDCKEGSYQDPVNAPDFKTFLTPAAESDYYERMDSHRLTKFLYNSEKKMDYLNEFGDCVLEGVPAEAHLEDLPKLVNEATLKTCLGNLLKVAKE